MHGERRRKSKVPPAAGGADLPPDICPYGLRNRPPYAKLVRRNDSETRRALFLSSVQIVYFSPTGTTRRLSVCIGQTLAEKLEQPAAVHDVTSPESRAEALRFGPDDTAVIAFPVYAGRLPNLLLPYIKTLRGDRTAAVPLVVFGNRCYDDALPELGLLLESQGFRCVSAAAFAGEHAFSRILGAGRPDEADLLAARSFAEKTARKLKQGLFPQSIWDLLGEPERPLRPYYIPRDTQGNPINILKVKPKLDPEKCVSCKKCVTLCPMVSIRAENVAEISGICIKCGACVKGCPNGARYFDDPGYLLHTHILEEQFSRRAEPSLFL